VTSLPTSPSGDSQSSESNSLNDNAQVAALRLETEFKREMSLSANLSPDSPSSRRSEDVRCSPTRWQLLVRG